ncbi:MAG: hypothetical protein AAF790_00050 [Planctomycetota bacterium]
MLDQLGLRLGVDSEGDGPRLTVTAQQAAAQLHAAHPPGRLWSGGLKTRRRRPEAAVATPEFVGEGPAQLLAWLAERLAGHDTLPCFTPRDEPHAVHEFVNPMFAAYTVDGGMVHLGGCHLEDWPMLRLTTFSDTAAAGAPGVTHRFFDAEGHAVDAALAEGLRVLEVEAARGQRPRRRREAWRPAIATATAGSKQGSPAIASLVLAKRAHGRLAVTIGEATHEIEFAGWTRTLTAPPATCPETGVETYHLTALADGRIVAAEAAARCEATGDRRLKRDLATCAVTGKTMGVELTERCPVLGKPVRKDAFGTCPTCSERVARTTLLSQTCLCCHEPPRAARDNDRVAALLGAHAGLRSFGRWRLSETETAVVFRGRKLLRQVLVVVDRKTHAVRECKSRTLRGKWQPWDADRGGPRDSA